MVRLVLYLAGLAVVVAVAVWLADAPGTAAIEWRGWRVDTSASVLIAALAAAALLIALLLRGAAIVAGVMNAVAVARRERQLAKGLTSLADGFAAVQAGQTGAARRLAKEAGALLKANPAVLMLRKDAAEMAHDTREAKEAAVALLERPQTELAGLRTLALKAKAEGDVVGALNHAKRALARKDAPSWAIETALDLAIASGLWRDALALMETRIARDTFAPEEFARLKTRVLLHQAQSDLKSGDPQGAAALAKQAVDLGGAPVAATAAYARAMAALGKGRKAAHLVEKQWGESPHADLAAAYRLLVPGETALEWARRVDTLARIDPDHPETRLAVARASLDAQLWGQARNRLATLTGTDTAPELRARAARLMAEVETRERHDAEKATEWLEIALEALRAPPLASAPRSAAELAKP